MHSRLEARILEEAIKSDEMIMRTPGRERASLAESGFLFYFYLFIFFFFWGGGNRTRGTGGRIDRG